MKTILITGGIGSGKSAVCHYLAGKGIPVYDTDSRAKNLYYTDPQMVREIESFFGIRLFNAEGQLDKKILSELIFSDKVHLEQLEAIVHPAVLRDFMRWRSEQENVPFVCMESAIVLDKPLFSGCYDRVIVVDAPEQMRLERAALRDASPQEKILSRMRAQRVHLEKADAVIINDGSLDTLEKRVDEAIGNINL